MMTTIQDPVWTTKSTGANVGFTTDGTPVHVYVLRDDGIEVAVMNYGARIVSIRTPDRYGNLADVVLSYSGLDGFVADVSSYLGAVVGRYANRIAEGHFSIDGHTIQTAINNGANTLHGGSDGFDRRVWAAHSFSSGVELTLKSEDGDQGFPGNLAVRVRYTVMPRALRIDYFFTTDRTTVVNLTNHAYFNLSGHPETSILGDELAIAADYYTPIDSRLIPVGTLLPVDDTPFDFRSRTVIGSRIESDDRQLELAGGYDHNFVLTGEAGELRKVAHLHNPDSGRTLTVSTTEPGVQFYTGNFLDGTSYGAAQERHGRRTGLCLETQHFPDSPNHSNFPSTELRPGQMGGSTTIFEFSVDTPWNHDVAQSPGTALHE
jgi:aldose 1-epimerase